MEQDYDQEQTGVATEPTAIPVRTQGYWLPFRVPTGLMPDRQFDGRPARLWVHRVYPENPDTRASVATHAVVLIHGRTVPGPVVFDLGGTDTFNRVLSVQKRLAEARIDTFAPSLLGYGRSTRFDEGLNPYDQQGTMLLGGRPLVERRRHSSNFRFARTDVWVRDIDQVIAFAIALSGRNKVALVGYSLGGQHVGRTLYADNQNEQLLYAHDALDPNDFNEDLHDREEVIEKVSRVVFLNSLFFPNGPTEEPANPFPTFPLTLNGKTTPFTGSDALWTTFTDNPQCPGRIIDGTKDQVWNQTMEHETVGRAWGPIPYGDASPASRAGGLNRAPTFSGYGWNKTVARQLKLDIPTLVMQGLEDGGVPIVPPATTPGKHAE